jgi:hypothetical protein
LKIAATLERKTLKEICDSLKENRVWHFRTNQELIRLYSEADIISEIRKGRLRRLGHLQKMPEVITVKEVFKNIKMVNVRWKAKKKMVK